MNKNSVFKHPVSIDKTLNEMEKEITKSRVREFLLEPQWWSLQISLPKKSQKGEKVRK